MTDDFNRALQLLAGPRGHVHFIGICGVGMAALAFQLKQKGFRVSGCDLRADELATWLEGLGIEVRRGHDPAHLAEAQWVVRTAAVRPDHPEIISAVARGISVLPRGLVLAALLREFFSVIVCGSHGKTTTTAMLTQIFTSAGREPSFCIGGVVPAATEPVALQRPPECILEGGRLDRRGSVAGAGAGNFLLAEADESDGTLSFYEPDIAIVTNIEFDHAEHFTCLAELRACFQKMLKKVRRNIVYCRDDPEAAALCRDLAKGVSYGLASGGHSFSSRARPPATLGVALRAGEGVDSSCADWRATAIKEQAESISFQVWRGAEKMGIVNLPAPGRHNALNALAACAAAQACGIEFAASQAGLQTFQPVRRRFERLIATPDVQVITDYAHHPSEITATLANLPRLKRKRFFAVFQPHRYSRTRALVREFAAALSARGRSARGGKNVDELILTPVYAASELPLTGGTHWDLYEQVRQAGHLRVFAASSLAQAWGYLRTVLQRGNGLLILGAGDVEQIGHWARAEISERGLAELDPARAWAAALEKMPWEKTAWQRSAPLADKTTLRVGGAADILAQVSSEADLTRLLHWAHDSQVPVHLLGAGSNMLVSDLGVRGVVVRLDGQVFRQIRREAETQVVSGAAVRLKELTGRLAADGFSGLEFLTGIPGTVGGALRMNAGAFGESTSSRVLWVRFLNPDGSVQVAEAAALSFGYRSCPGLAGKTVLDAAFQVTPSNQANVRRRMADILKQRTKFDRGCSAGSVFRNPGPRSLAGVGQAGRPEGDFAGRLLELCRLKGRRLGGAKVSEKHANIIVTGRGAVASDVRALMEIMARAVRDKFGVALKEEIVCLE